jgi:hypothetical protein
MLYGLAILNSKWRGKKKKKKNLENTTSILATTQIWFQTQAKIVPYPSKFFPELSWVEFRQLLKP